MSDSVHELIVWGIASAKAGENSLARRYLERALRLGPEPDQVVNVLYWLSKVCDDPTEKREYLMEALSVEPNNHQTRRSLAILDGLLKPQEIVDPDKLPRSIRTGQVQAETLNFTCPKCGGRLTYAPNGVAFNCEYCEGRHRPAFQRHDRGSAPKNFSVTMATLKGHSRPSSERSVECHSCGAPLVLDADDLTIRCPYCLSAYVVEQIEGENVFVIEGIIPFVLTQFEALKVIRAFLESKYLSLDIHVDALRGFYLPAWLFSISAGLGRGEKFVQEILVSASRTFPEEWGEEIERFDLDRLVGFSPAYLVDWPAETYQVSLSDASLDARFIALERVRSASRSRRRRVSRLSSMDLMIEDFKLVLLPFWIFDYTYHMPGCVVLVNGQSGRACSPAGAGSFQEGEDG